MESACPGCGVILDHREGPSHDYMLSSAGCWERYGLILAREYENPVLFAAAHRWTVDAYALQHPGLQDERRAYRSVRMHYVSLHLIFEHGRSHRAATAALQKLAKLDYLPLPERPASFSLSSDHVLAAERSEHVERVEAWARSAFEAWNTLRLFADEVIARLGL